MAALLRSLLSALHAPLDLADGEVEWCPAPRHFVDQLRDTILVEMEEGYGAERDRAIQDRRIILYRSERPPDVLEWLRRTRGQSVVKGERTELLKLLAEHVRREGPGRANSIRARDVVHSLCRDESSHEDVRKEAFAALRAIVKRDDCREDDALRVEWGKWARSASEEFKSAMAGRMAGGARAECLKLVATMVSYYVDDDDKVRRRGNWHSVDDEDLKVMPWTEAGDAVAGAAIHSLRKWRDAQMLLAAAFVVYERLVTMTRRYSEEDIEGGPSASLRHHAPLVATKIVTVLQEYAFGGTYRKYELPAKALRCLERCAHIVANDAAKTITSGPNLNEAPSGMLFELVEKVALIAPSSDEVPEKIEKHATRALESCCRVLSASEEDGLVIFNKLELRVLSATTSHLVGFKSNARTAGLALAAVASTHLEGDVEERIFALVLRASARCDDIDERLQRQARFPRRFNQNGHTFEVRSAALRAASAHARGNAQRLALTTRLAVRCAHTHASRLSGSSLSKRARQMAIDGFVEYYLACEATEGGRAGARILSRAALVAASTRHGGGIARLNPETGDYDDRVCFEAAKHWRHVMSRADNAYGAMISCAFSGELLNALDLGYEMITGQDGVSTPIPNNRFDHELLVNLGSFLCNIKHVSGYWAARENWSLEACRRLVRLSRDRIHVSALHRLCSVAASGVDKAGLLQKEGKIYRLLRGHFADVACSAPSFTDDELLAAACDLTLGGPLSLQTGQLERLAGCMRAALRSSRLRTAQLAFSTLESWARYAPRELVAKVLPDVLDELDKYARASFSSKSGDFNRSSRFISEKALRRDARRRTASDAADQTVSEAAAMELARRAVRLLGSLGSENAKCVADTTRALADGVAWASISDSGKGSLALDVHALLLDDNNDDGNKQTFQLRLDAVVPRLAELATWTGARETRMLATEALHSCLSHAVGCVAASLGTASAGLEPLFERALPVVVKLAAADDPVARSLFGTSAEQKGTLKGGFLMQLAHWLGWSPRNRVEIRTLTRHLIDALFAALDDQSFESSGRQREVAAAALAELVKSLAKTTDTATLAAVDHGSDDVLGRVFSRVLADVAHAYSAARRRGGSLATRKLIRHLVNKTPLLSRFGLALLKSSLQAIKRSGDAILQYRGGEEGVMIRIDRDVVDLASEASELLCNAIAHRIINHGDDARLLFDDAKPVQTHRFAPRYVSELLDWAWREGTGDTNHKFRRRCWRTLGLFAPLVVPDDGVFHFVRSKLAREDSYKSVFEKNALPQVVWDDSVMSSRRQLSQLHATLHTYAFFVEQKLVSAGDALSECRERVFTPLARFLASLRRNWVANEVLSSDEDDLIKKERCGIARRGALLASALIDRCGDRAIQAVCEAELWSNDALEAWLRCLIEPSMNGVLLSPAEDAEVDVMLPGAVARVLCHADRLDCHSGRNIGSVIRDVLDDVVPRAWRHRDPESKLQRSDFASKNFADEDTDGRDSLGGAARLYRALKLADKLEYGLGGPIGVDCLAMCVGRAVFAEFRFFPWLGSISAKNGLDLVLDTLGLQVVPQLLDLAFEDDQLHDGKLGGVYDFCTNRFHRAFFQDAETWRQVAEVLTRRDSPLSVRMMTGAMEYSLAIGSPHAIDGVESLFSSPSVDIDFVLLALKVSHDTPLYEHVRGSALNVFTDTLNRSDDNEDPVEAERATRRLLPRLARTKSTTRPLEAIEMDQDLYQEAMDALKKREKVCVPSRWNEFLETKSDENRQKQRAYDGYLKALCDAYSSTAAPELLDFLVRRLNELGAATGRRPHGRASWLRGALRCAGRRATPHVAIDALHRLGFCGDVETPFEVAVLYFSPTKRKEFAKKLPRYKPAAKRALVEVLLFEALLGEHKQRRRTVTITASCRSNGQHILDSAIEFLASDDVYLVHAAAILLQAALDPTLGETGRQLAESYALHHTDGDSSTALRRQVLRKVRERLQREETRLSDQQCLGLTMEELTPKVASEAPARRPLTRDDRAAYCALFRLYVTVGVATQKKSMLCKMSLWPDETSLWRACTGSNFRGVDSRYLRSTRQAGGDETTQSFEDAEIDGSMQARLETYTLTVGAAYSRSLLLENGVADARIEAEAEGYANSDFAGLSTNARKMLAGSSLSTILDPIVSGSVAKGDRISSEDDGEGALLLTQQQSSDDDAMDEGDVEMVEESSALGCAREKYSEADEDEASEQHDDAATDELAFAGAHGDDDVTEAHFAAPEDAVNQHPCMHAFVSAVKEIVTDESVVTKFLALFNAHLRTSECLTSADVNQPAVVKQLARNVTIFLLQVVVNTADALAMFADLIRDEIVAASLRALAMHPNGVQGIDFLLRDVVTILTSEDWRPSADSGCRPASPDTYRKFAGELIRLSHYHAGDDQASARSASGARVTEDNVALVYQFLEVFADILFTRDEPTHFFEQPILELLKAGENESHYTGGRHASRLSAGTRRKNARRAGLAMVRSVIRVANDHGMIELVLQQSLVSAVLDCFSDPTNLSDVYTLAAEVVGDILAAWRDIREQKGSAPPADCLETIRHKLKSLKPNADEHTRSRIIALLRSATLADPENFPSREWHINYGLKEINTMKSKQRADVLEAIAASGVENFDDVEIFDKLLENSIDELLSDAQRKQDLRQDHGRDARPIVQIKLFQLLHSRANTFATHKLCSAVIYGKQQALTHALPTYRDVELRKCVYAMLMALHDLYYPVEDNMESSSPPDGEVRSHVRRLLLCGLNDPDLEGMQNFDGGSTKAMTAMEQQPGVRRRVYDYWRARLPLEPQKRLDELLSEVFVCGEASPHRFAASVLLSPVATSIQWRKPLHASPLDEHISQAAQELDMNGALAGASHAGPAFSIEAQFDFERRRKLGLSSATSQAAASLAPLYHDKLILATQESSQAQLYQTQLDTFSDPRAAGRAATLASQNILRTDLFSVRNLPGPPPPPPPPPPAEEAGEEHHATSTIQRPAKTVVKRTVRFAEGTKFLAEWEQARKKNRPMLYRTYKAMELPDIQVTLADVLRPISALALRDDQLASALFEQLFAQLYERRRLPERRREACELVENALSDTIRAGTRSSELVAALHRACVQAMSTTSDEDSMNGLKVSTVAESAARAGVYEPAAVLVERIMTSTGDALGSFAELRRLYSAYGDVDTELAVCDAVFAGELHAAARAALEAEGLRDYRRALELYDQDLETNLEIISTESDVAKRVVDARCMRLALELGDWNSAASACEISANADGDDDLLQRCLGMDLEEEDNFDGTETLTIFITAVAHASPPGRTDTKSDARQSALLETLQKNRVAQSWVEAHAACPIALAFIIKDDFASARKYIDAGFDNVAATWVSLHTCAFAARAHQLREMARLSEIDACLSVSLAGITLASSSLGALRERWEAMPIGPSDPAQHWMRSARSRASCAYTLRHRLGQQCKFSGTIPDKRSLKQHLLGIQQQIMRFAIERGDLDVARSIKSNVECSALSARLSLATARRLTFVSSREPANCRSSFEQALAATDALGVGPAAVMTEFAMAIRSGAAEAGEYSVDELDRRVVKQFLEDVAQDGTFSSSLELAEFLDSAARDKRHSVVDFLASQTMSDDDDDGVDSACVSCAIRHYVRAITGGDFAGVTRAVPRLLSRLCLEGDATAARVFLRETTKHAKCVVWAFEDWTWQVVELATGHDERLRSALFPVVRELARDRPARMRDPIRFAVELGSSEGRAIAKRLQKLCHNEGAEVFTVALEGLIDPEHRARDGFTRVLEALQRGPEERDDNLRPEKRQRIEPSDSAIRAWQKLRDGVFATSNEAVGTKVGLRNFAFAQFWGTEILRCADRESRLASRERRYPSKERRNAKYESMVKIAIAVAEQDFGVSGDDAWESGGELLSGGPSAKRKVTALRNFFGELADLSKGSRVDPDLKDFSTYLREYDGGEGEALDVPGSCRRETLKILAFDPSLIAMPSLRRPKKLTMRCSDGIDRSVLVKGGEDLRNDERIQRLFVSMNGILAATVGHKARLRVYSVVPLTPQLGLIEWVDGATTLGGIIEQRLGKKGASDAGRAAGEARNSSLRISGDIESYHRVAFQASRQAASEAFETARDALKVRGANGALRRHMIAIAPRPEVFVAIRSRYLASLACSSACTYLVGIGDRHSGNVMLDTHDFSVVHIDFGASFGAGHHLAIPELVPFRLTQELCAPFEPMNARSVLHRQIATALASFRKSRATPTLHAVLDAFARDPLVDWMQKKRQQRDRPASSALSSKDDEAVPSSSKRQQSLNPEFRVQQALEKLRGVHPKTVLKSDLGVNKWVRRMKSLSALNIALGDESPDPGVVLTPTQQAQALVALATDTSLLARHYAGWAPWW